MCILSSEHTSEVWRALKKLGFLLAALTATITLSTCSPQFPRAFITRSAHAQHEPLSLLELNRAGRGVGATISLSRNLDLVAIILTYPEKHLNSRPFSDNYESKMIRPHPLMTSPSSGRKNVVGMREFCF